MPVTIPMIISTTAAIQRNPPQEVKSTYDEKQVIKQDQSEVNMLQAT